MKGLLRVTLVSLLLGLKALLIGCATNTTEKTTVSFDFAGGAGEFTEMVLNSGPKVSVPNDPKKEGYIQYWSDGVGRYDFNTKPSEDTQLTAVWKKEGSENPDSEHPDPGETGKGAYYDSVDLTTTGSTLVGALNSRLWSGVKWTGYGSGTNTILRLADQDLTNTSQVYLIYDGKLMKKNDNGSGGPMVWNKEHVWPNSKMGGHQKGDVHNLRGCQAEINSKRSNYPFMAGSSAFFPGDDHKGDVARIMFYMVTINPNLKLSTMGGAAMLLRWHVEDQVNAFEIKRNNILIEHQKNRNPHIDNSGLATKAFGSTKTLIQELNERTEFFDTFLIESIEFIREESNFIS